MLKEMRNYTEKFKPLFDGCRVISVNLRLTLLCSAIAVVYAEIASYLKYNTRLALSCLTQVRSSLNGLVCTKALEVQHLCFQNAATNTFKQLHRQEKISNYQT